MGAAIWSVLAPLASAALVHCFVPAARWLAHRYGLFDHPSWRRNQKEAVPCSGGLAIYVAILVAGLVLTATVGAPFAVRPLAALSIAGLAMIVLGAVDDRFGLHAEKKLLGQIVVVSLPMASGLLLDRLYLPGVGEITLGLLSGPVTLFWYLGFINSVNLIDGLDGLAGGIVALVLAALWTVVVPHDAVGALWILVSLGAVLGFLRHNLSSHRIFLGDAGSMLLGLWLAGLTLGLRERAVAAPWIVALAMAIPVLDTATTILRRRRRGVSVFRADDEHLHHRLMRLGMTARRAVAVLLLLTVACAAAGAMALGRAEAALLVLGGIAAAAVELAYTLPHEGSPRVGEALRYLAGFGRLSPEALPEELPVTAQLAPIIAIDPYQRRREQSADAPPAVGERAVQSASGHEADVVLALGDEPR
jgi:UDP-GlcNAc:undecaprenyl-phosphate GlcNAc-1-phosphate transferase